MPTQRNVLFVPSTLVAVTLGLGWSIAGGLVSCDSTAKFSLQDRKFSAIQVVSTFPVNIGAGGAITRVCGAPLDGSEPLPVNGLQFAVNMVGTENPNPNCEVDADQSIKEGERIEQQVVTTEAARRTVAINNWKLDIDCLGRRDAGTGSCQGINLELPSAADVRYAGTAPRCNKGDPGTWQSVAVIVDHSGSTSGQTTAVDTSAGRVGIEDEPEKVILETDFKDYASDPFHARVQAAKELIDRLSSNDRVISYFFDENAVSVACSSARTCDGGTKDGLACGTSADCGVDADGDPYSCTDRLDLNDTDANKFLNMDAQEQANNCFGAKAEAKANNKTGLELNAKLGGEGRAPVWAAVENAYDFFTLGAGKSASGPKHIVLFTDGPDTCTFDEDFNWKNLSGTAAQCRTECVQFAAQYKVLIDRMNQDGFPVRLHIIQFQSSGYKEPDARLHELACLSQGTFQFLNTEQFSKQDGSSFIKVLNEAAFRVRSALSGQWQVTYSLPGIQSNDPNGNAPLGAMMSLAGSLKFENKAFASLDTAYDPNNASKPYQFVLDGFIDGRLPFRKACRDTAECGGSDVCGAMRCTSQGLCEPDPAKDRLPCGDNKVCCGGICSATCTTGCSKN
jgi:hypothetical protein